MPYNSESESMFGGMDAESGGRQIHIFPLCTWVSIAFLLKRKGGGWGKAQFETIIKASVVHTPFSAQEFKTVNYLMYYFVDI